MASNLASSSSSSTIGEASRSSTTGQIVRLSSADVSQHAEALRELAAACFPGAVPADGDVLSALAGPWHDLSACEWLLAFDGSAVVGMALLVPYHDALQLSTLAVAPRVRRRGLGARLQEATRRRAIELGLPRVCGSVDADAADLLKRYRALGAVDDGSAICSPGALVKPKVRLSAPVAREAPFEWLLEWSQLEPLLTRLLDGVDPSTASAVDLGCGTSHLARNLAADVGFGRVVGVDRDPRHGAVHDWAAGGAAPGAPYDVAFDKSSLDATLAEGGAAGLLTCAFRSLEAGGRYVVCSLYPPDFVEALAAPLFAPAGRESVARGAAPPVAVLCLRKRECCDVDYAAMAAHCRGVQDAFFGAARPLLDEARREALRTSFSEALPLGTAFEALFTAEERRDYALADFLDDVAAFRGRRGGGGMGGEEALAFLAFAQ